MGARVSLDALVVNSAKAKLLKPKLATPAALSNNFLLESIGVVMGMSGSFSLGTFNRPRISI